LLEDKKAFREMILWWKRILANDFMLEKDLGK